MAGVGALFVAAVTAGGARAQTAFDTFANTFQIHGYVENQTIERSDTYVRDWHNASLRNRLNFQLSGTLAKHLDLPAMPGASIEYFLELRPGYEAAYDVDRDRFGNATTGFSGGAPGYSPFSRLAGLSLDAHPNAISNAFGFFPNYIQAFGNPASPYFVGTQFAYNPKQFQMVGPKDYGAVMPNSPSIPYLPRLEGVCRNCPNVKVPLSQLRWEIDDNNNHYYPVREAYFDVRWFWHGQNWLRLGKQEIVWGKADFFRLQDLVNNVDFAQHLNVEPFEDTRIPNWSASLQHRFGDVWWMHDLALAEVWNFDIFTPVGLGESPQAWQTSFGKEVQSFAFTGDTFEHAFNIPYVPPGFTKPCNSGMNPVGVCPKFGPHAWLMPAYNFKNMGYGAKLDWESEDPPIRFSVTDYFGEGDPVFRMIAPNIIATGINPLVFPLAGPTLAGNLPAVYSCLKARGIKEAPWAGGLGTVLMVPHPNENLGACLASSGYFKKGAVPEQLRALFMQTYGADGDNVTVFHKANTLGLSADYFDPSTGLVIRGEASWSHNVLVNDTTSFDWTANDEVLQWVIGADSQFFIRPLNKERTFFGSAQVFAKYLPGANSFGRTGVTARQSSYIFTAFLQTHYYRDRIIPLVFAAFDTLGTDAELGGNVEWLINNHWSAQIGSTAFLGKANKFDLTYDSPVKPGCFLNPNCTFNDHRYTEQFFGAAEQPLGAYRNVYDEIWTRLRYRF